MLNAQQNDREYGGFGHLQSSKPLEPDAGWSLNNIEQSLRRIAANPEMPFQLKSGFVNERKGAMYDAARLQMLATWARSVHGKYLYLRGADSKESAIKELCEYAPGIAALRLCEAVSIDGTIISRREALQSALDKMAHSDNFDLPKIIKCNAIDLTCISGAKMQYLRPLFDSRHERAVKGGAGMARIMERIADSIFEDERLIIPKPFIRACAIFASELMENTQEHATRKHTGWSYIEHVEGMLLSWGKMYEKTCKQDFESNARLLKFWNGAQLYGESEKERYLRCLQISFFDTGPGFAGRMTGKEISDLSVKEEKEAIFRCLHDGVSTKRREAGSGYGFRVVLTVLREIGGLIRTRTGRSNIFNVLSPHDDSDLLDFDDWFDEGTFHELAPVAGTVISLLLPIGKESNA